MPEGRVVLLDFLLEWHLAPRCCAVDRPEQVYDRPEGWIWMRWVQERDRREQEYAESLREYEVLLCALPKKQSTYAAVGSWPFLASCRRSMLERL